MIYKPFIGVLDTYDETYYGLLIDLLTIKYLIFQYLGLERYYYIDNLQRYIKRHRVGYETFCTSN